MTEETKAVEKVEPVATEEAGNASSNGKKKYDRPPVEELFDLSKPIKRVEKPSKEQYDKDLGAIDAEIDKLRATKDDIQNKIENFMKSLKGTEAGKERAAFRELSAKKQALIEEKNVIRSRLNRMKSQTDKLFQDQKQAKAGIRFTSIESIDAEIKKLQRRQETTSMSLSDEKKIIKEITQLQNSKSLVAQLRTKETNINDVKEQKKLINDELKAKDKEIDAVVKLINEKKPLLANLKQSEIDNKDQKKVLLNKRDELRKQIDEQFQEKNKVREAFREKNNEFYNYKRAIQAQKKIAYEEEKKKREEEHQAYLKKKEEEEMKKIPYEEEMALCDYLADYLSKTYLEDPKAKKAEKKNSAVIPVKDDPFAGFKPMKKNDDEVFLKMGKGKQPRKRIAKNEKKSNKATPFHLNIDSFDQFGLLNLSPPTKLEMVEESVKELREKKKWYSEQPRGSVPTATEIRKAKEKAGSSGDSKSKSTSSSKSSKGKGAFSLTEDDFVPLGEKSGRVSVNSTWGQKSAEAPEVAVESPAVDAVEEVEA